jgi:hypothetical protein
LKAAQNATHLQISTLKGIYRNRNLRAARGTDH